MLARLPYAYPYSTQEELQPLAGAGSAAYAGGSAVGAQARPMHPASQVAPATALGRQQTTSPTVTGSSVIAFKFKGGVIMGGDTLGSYGSMARYRSLERLRAVGSQCLIGATGEYSDFQYLHQELTYIVTDDEHADDGHSYAPKSIFSLLSRIMYGRRNKMDPLYNYYVLAGYRTPSKPSAPVSTTGAGAAGDAAAAAAAAAASASADDKKKAPVPAAGDEEGPFLGTTDLQGTNYEDDIIATGYAGHLAMPILRRDHRLDMNEDEARELLIKCLEVCYYRDARSSPKVQVAVVTADGVTVGEPFELNTDWKVGRIVYPDPVKNTTPAHDDGAAPADA